MIIRLFNFAIKQCWRACLLIYGRENDLLSMTIFSRNQPVWCNMYKSSIIKTNVNQLQIWYYYHGFLSLKKTMEPFSKSCSLTFSSIDLIVVFKKLYFSMSYIGANDYSVLGHRNMHDPLFFSGVSCRFHSYSAIYSNIVSLSLSGIYDIRRLILWIIFFSHYVKFSFA